MCQNNTACLGGLEISHQFAILIQRVIRRCSLRHQANDVGVIQGFRRQAAGKLVVQHAVGRDKPLCQRAVNQQQQDADECQRYQSVAFGVISRVQGLSCPCFKDKSIGKCRYSL